MNTMTQMARTYRSMCKQVKRTDSQIRKVRAQLNELGKSRNRIIQDLEQLRTLMDYCVITGEEPTQAKLTHTVEQMNMTISEHRRHMRPDEFYYTVGGSSVTAPTSGLSRLNTCGMVAATAPNVTTIMHESIQNQMDLGSSITVDSASLTIT